MRRITVITKPASRIRGHCRPGFFRLPYAASLLFILFLIIPRLGQAQTAAPNTLLRAAIGSGPDYARLVFTFQEPLDTYALTRTDVNRLSVDLGPAYYFILTGKTVLSPNESRQATPE